MSNSMTITLVLAGHYAGETMKIKRHQFVNGEMTFTGTGEQIFGVALYLKRYNAHMQGSPELADAQRVYAEEMEKKHGKRDTAGSDKSGEQPVESNVQSSGSGPTEVQASARDGAVDPEAGSEGVLPNGSGLQDSGDDDGSNQERLSNNLRLEKIIHSLNPDNDDHWTQAGKPRLTVIEDALDGDTGITRADIDNAAPGFDREAAIVKTLE